MPLPDIAPLPEYHFDHALSEDENFLTWVTVLSRCSYSRKGHMAAMIVRPSDEGSYDPRTSSAPSTSSLPSSPTRHNGPLSSAASRVVVYANNYPINYVQNPKSAGEIHAETHCIALAARHGKSIGGCTLYVTFPPCNECSRVIIAAGIRRCVFRKGITRDKNEQILVAAAASGMEMVGTSAVYSYLPSLANSHSVASSPTQESSSLSALPTEDDLPSLLQAERQAEEAREARAKVNWNRNGETAQITRTRVDDFWKGWLQRHSDVARRLQEDWSLWEAMESRGKEMDGTRWMGKLVQEGGKGSPMKEEEDRPVGPASAEGPPDPTGAGDDQGQDQMRLGKRYLEGLLQEGSLESGMTAQSARRVKVRDDMSSL